MALKLKGVPPAMEQDLGRAMPYSFKAICISICAFLHLLLHADLCMHVSLEKLGACLAIYAFLGRPLASASFTESR